jgi:hypothetical protein
MPAPDRAAGATSSGWTGWRPGDGLDDELRLPFDLERGDGLMLLPE